MNREELLKELEPLTHDARTVRMIELGRLANEGGTQAGEVAATLHALEQGGFYERRLALVSCFSSRDGARVLRYLSDPSRMLRSLAARLVMVACDDDQTQAALEAVAPKLRTRLLRRLVKLGRSNAIDLYLAGMEARGELGLERALAFGSEAFVKPRLEKTLPHAGAGHRTRKPVPHHQGSPRSLRLRAKRGGTREGVERIRNGSFSTLGSLSVL